MACTNRKLRIILIVLASICMLIALMSLLLVLQFDRLFLSILYKKLALLPNSIMYDNWLKPSLPIYFSVYLYNLTNKDEFLNGSRPHFDEVGPFVYRESRERFDVNFSSHSPPKRVRYKHRIYYYFVPEMSVGLPTDGKITTIDVLNAGFLAAGLASQNALMEKSPEEVMWGYGSTLLSTLYFFGQAPSNSAGLFATLNGTQVDEFEMDTGVDNIFDIGKIYEANGETKMTLWESEEANTIKGTDGSLASPGMRTGAEFDVFVPSLCRSARSYAIGSTRTKEREDIEVTVFSGSRPGRVDNQTQQMFCKSGYLCPPRGLITLEPCLATKDVNVPMYLSQPRFLDADPSVSKPFDGILPANEKDHSTKIHIEPTTGIILEAFKNVQFNIRIKNDPPFNHFSQPVFWPLAWISETVVADRVTLDRLYNELFLPRRMVPFIVSIVGAVHTVLAVSLVLALLILPRMRARGSRASKARAVASRSASSPLSSSITSSGDAAANSKLVASSKVDPVILNTHWSTDKNAESGMQA